MPQSKRNRFVSQEQQKQAILQDIETLQEATHDYSRDFNMYTPIEELRKEYNRLQQIKETLDIVPETPVMAPETLLAEIMRNFAIVATSYMVSSLQKKNPNLLNKHEERISSDTAGKCVICMEERYCILVQPCNHMCYCEICFLQVQEQNSQHHCPICKTYVANTIKTFLP